MKHRRIYSNIGSIANELAYAINPELFAMYVFDISPDKWQRDLLWDRPQSALLLCSRQSGKSTISATIALHKALYEEDSLVLIISKSLRQAEELFRKVKYGINKAASIRTIIRENQSMAEFSNGSRIISLPGKEDTIRSFSKVSLLIIDEAAQVSDELYATIRPMLAISLGKILALSTPFGKRGWFFKAWITDNDWHKIKVTADECPRISDEFIENERREVGDWWVNQEYFCQFVDTEDQIFTHDLVVNSVDQNVKAWNFSIN